ncbi:hypothetical protein HDU98_009034 [Podochytrium sp. JEL0797]|nr:hypothetical protein HDU98_009034 [Podochytrium sp. JEL0797]
MRLPVQWGDQDAHGALSHVALYRMFESARLEYFETAIGPQLSAEVQHGFLRGKGVGRSILRSATFDAKASAFYPDTLVLGARTSVLQHNRIIQEYIAVSEKTQCVVAEGSAVISMFDHVAKKRAEVPAEVAAAVKLVEGKNLLVDMSFSSRNNK